MRINKLFATMEVVEIGLNPFKSAGIFGMSKIYNKFWNF